MSWPEMQEWLRSPRVDWVLGQVKHWAGVIGLVAFTLALSIRAWQEGKK